MSEYTPEEGGMNVDDDDGYEPPASQADLDRIIGERLARERSKFADYDTLREQATEFQTLVEASKSDQERLEERAATAEQRAEQHAAELMRMNVALSHGFVVQQSDGTFAVDQVAVDLLGTGTEEELTKRAEQIDAMRANRPNGQPDLRAAAGQRPVVQEATPDDWLRRLARGG